MPVQAMSSDLLVCYGIRPSSWTHVLLGLENGVKDHRSSTIIMRGASVRDCTRYRLRFVKTVTTRG